MAKDNCALFSFYFKIAFQENDCLNTPVTFIFLSSVLWTFKSWYRSFLWTQDMFMKVDEPYFLLSLYFLSLGLPNTAWDGLLLKIVCCLSEIQTPQCIPYFYLVNLATQLLFQEVFYMWTHLSSPCRISYLRFIHGFPSTQEVFLLRYQIVISGSAFLKMKLSSPHF